jgi:hypothetical protein
MSNTDFDPQQQAPPQQPYFPPPPASPLTQLIQQQQRPPIPQLPSMQIASAETPGINFTGGRQDAVPRDARTDLPAPAVVPPPEPTVAPPPNISRNRPFQRYIPASSRDSGWGSNSPSMIAGASNPALSEGPFMPSDREAVDVIRVAGRQLGQWGAPAVAQPMNFASQLAAMIGPAMDFYSQNAFSSHYRDRYLGGLEQRKQALTERREQYIMDRERMVDYARQAMGNHKAILEDYDDVFNRYGRHEITKEEAEQEIRNLNIQNNHTAMDVALNNHGLSGVRNALKLEDARFQDVMSGVISMDQARKRDPEKKKADAVTDTWFEKEGGDRALPSTPPGTPEAPEAAAPTKAPLSEFDQQLVKDHPGPDGQKLTPEAVRQAHDIYRNGKPTGLTDTGAGKLNPKAYDVALGAAGAIGTAIEGIANGEGTPEEKITRIRKIDPTTATEIQGLTNYQTDPKGLGVAQRERLIPLAEAASNNKYKQSWYDIDKKMTDPNGAFNKELTRVGMLGKAGLTVAQAVKELPLDEKIPMRKIMSQLSTKWTGDAKYTNLYHAIQGFANEVGAVGSGTGTSRVAIFNRLVEHMSEASSPEQILGGMVAEMQPGQTVLDQAVSFWQEQTGSKTLPPVLNSRMVQDYDAVVHMNTRTGEMPPGSSIAVTSASREVSDKSKGYWKPLSRQDRTTLREWVEENRDNPDPAVQERVRAGIHKLGINP